jgi:integrase
MSVLYDNGVTMSKQQVLRQGPVKITRAVIDAAWKKREPAHRTILSDADCRGLALIVNATSMAWRFEYKPRGVDPLTGKRFASRSMVLGNPASLSPDVARDVANKLKGEAKAGSDPAAQKKAKLAVEARKRAGTMKRLLDMYKRALPRRPKLRGGHGTLSARAVAEELSHTSAAILTMNGQDKSADAVSGADIKRMLELLADKPATARHRFGALSRFYDWAQDEGHVAANPCAQLAKARRPRPPRPRPVFHSPTQLAQLWQAINAADGLHQVHRDLLHFLIVVPCRRGEATEMQWGDIDLAIPFLYGFSKVIPVSLVLEFLLRNQAGLAIDQINPDFFLTFGIQPANLVINLPGLGQALQIALQPKNLWRSRVIDHFLQGVVLGDKGQITNDQLSVPLQVGSPLANTQHFLIFDAVQQALAFAALIKPGSEQDE